MSSPSYDWQEQAYTEQIALRQESVWRVAKREANLTPEKKAQQDAEIAAWIAARDAPKAKKTPKPSKAPKKEASRKRKRPTDDPVDEGGQDTTSSSNTSADAPPPPKRGRGRPKGSRNKPKPGQQQAPAEAQQQPSPPREPSPVDQQGNVNGHTGSSLDPFSLPPSPSPLQERGPEGPLDNPLAAQSEASQQQPLSQALTDYFGQRLEAAARARKTSPPPIPTPPQEKASVDSAQVQAQSEPMAGSEENAEAESPGDEFDEDKLIEEFDSLEDEEDLFGDHYLAAPPQEKASVASAHVRAQNEAMPGSEENAEEEDPDDDQLVNDYMSLEDEDDLFGDAFVKNNTTTQVHHDSPKAASPATSAAAFRSASETASHAASGPSTTTTSTVVSGSGSGSGSASSAAATVAPPAPSVATSEAEIEAEMWALIDANLEGIQEAPELAVPGPALGVEFRAAWSGASNVASSAPPGTASRATPTPVAGRAQPGVHAMNGYRGQPHLTVAGAGLGLPRVQQPQIYQQVQRPQTRQRVQTCTDISGGQASTDDHQPYRPDAPFHSSSNPPPTGPRSALLPRASS
ncbi:hypothetical protein N0V85_005324 [Neurospora sp. IMI 360204]|nr:hypothetical protein N0V85_005324 [Neurospora sp. IMI 360204]